MTSHPHSYTVKRISTDAPWRWLALGWADMRAAPALSLAYGAAFVIVGFGITAGLWWLGLSSLIPVAAAGFMLAGPLLAVGLYEISRRRETATPITSWREIVFIKTASPLQLAYIGFFISFVMMLWGRMAQIIYAIFTNGDYVPLMDFANFVLSSPQGLALLVVGTAVGAVLAFIIFAISAVSVPMLMDRDVDVVTAMIASVQSVTENSGAMLLWAWLIAVLVGFGIATCFLGLIVVFPLVGHATWHAYRALVDRGEDVPSADGLSSSSS